MAKSNSEVHDLFEHFRRPRHGSLFLFRYLPVKSSNLLVKKCPFTGQPRPQKLTDLSCLSKLGGFLGPGKEKYKVIARQEIFAYFQMQYDVSTITSILTEIRKF